VTDVSLTSVGRLPLPIGFLASEPITFEAYRARKRIAGLDGLRAIAVLLVVTVHMHDRVWARLHGGLGVVIFFVLSGYLITTLALREEQMRGSLDFVSFYIRRTFRIFPLYYVVLAGYAVLILALKVSSYKSDVFVHALPYYAFYLQEIPYFRHLYPSMPFYQTWTLGIEEKFYLVWPALAFGPLALAKKLRSLVTGAAATLFLLSPIWSPWYQLENYAYILAGALIAVLLEERAGFRLMQRLGGGGLTLLIPVLLLLQLWEVQSVSRTPARSAYALVFAVILGIFVVSDGTLQRMFSHPAAVFVGQLSYGIYLVHVLCLNIAERVFVPGRGLALPAYALACLLSIAAAFILHWSVEQPMIRFGKALSTRQLGMAHSKKIEVAATPEFEGAAAENSAISFEAGG
jgi:peptidoglycan/LPS O-acetylase OafA/YrhL